MKRRALISHFVVTRGGAACALVQNRWWATKGVLLVDPEEPTHFTCDRKTLPRYATKYARRSCERAIKRTLEFISTCRNSMADEHEFVARVIAGPTDFKVVPVKPAAAVAPEEAVDL